MFLQEANHSQSFCIFFDLYKNTLTNEEIIFLKLLKMTILNTDKNEGTVLITQGQKALFISPFYTHTYI